MARDKKDIVAIIVTLSALAGALFFTFRVVNAWAAGAFARPAMGSALVAVIELGLLLLALALAPAGSRLIRLLLGGAAAPAADADHAGDVALRR